MESLPKVKLDQVGVGSNIAQNHSSSLYIWPLLAPNYHEKVTKYEIGRYYLLFWCYLPLFVPKIKMLPIFSLTYLYLSLFTYIYLYYLPLFGHICP